MEKWKDELKQVMREKYESQEVPEEARERIKMGIEQAKQDMGKKRIPAYVKWAGFGIAAACLCIVTLANLSSTTAYALQRIPVLGDIAKVVTFREYKDNKNNFEALVSIPKITDEVGNTKELEQTNKTIEEYANEFISQYENDLRKSEGLGNYELKSTYQVIREDEKELVLGIDTTLVMASGTEYKKVFNIDKNTGRIKKLADYFREDSNYIDVLTEEIQRQMREQMKDNDEVCYYIDSEPGFDEWDFKRLSEDVDFYFDEDGDLVVLFDEYEVAPGYMGAVTFVIDKDIIPLS